MSIPATVEKDVDKIPGAANRVLIKCGLLVIITLSGWNIWQYKASSSGTADEIRELRAQHTSDQAQIATVQGLLNDCKSENGKVLAAENERLVRKSDIKDSLIKVLEGKVKK